MNLFDLYAKISLDSSEYESGIAKASSSGESFASKLKSGFSAIGTAAAAGMSAAVTAVGSLAKSSLEAYSSYEQLVGGVQTLFSEQLSLEEFADAAGYTVDEIRDRYNELANAPNVVMENAAKAFKTAGMSANDYMETVTSFSATLLQGLSGDTAEAAAVADKAIVDMSDNANKMGTSMTLIQNAYQGFAKQNYTMLDNLKLGYGGTQSEMARLINDSGVLGDAVKVTAESVRNVPFDQVIEAIHVIQTEMGITGTTAKEASTTIEGSVNSAKAAWMNLIVGIADENANLSDLTSQFVESAATVAANVLPRITQILGGIGSAIQQLAPVLSEQIPGIISQVLPPLVSSGAQLITALITGIVQSVPQLLQQIPPIITQVAETLGQALPQIAAAGGQLIDMLASGLENGVPDMLGRLPVIIEGFLGFITDNLPSILEKGVEILNSLANGILQAVPDLVASLPEIITAFVNFITENLPTILQSGVDILTNLATGIIQTIPKMVSQIPQIIEAFTAAISEAIPQIVQAGVDMLTGLADGIIKNIPAVVAAIPQIITAFVNGFNAFTGSIASIGKSIVQGVWTGISGMVGWFTGKVRSFFSGIVNSVKSALGIHSPSKVFAGIGENMALGLGQGWDDEYSRIKRDIDGGLNFSGSASLSASGGGQPASVYGRGIGAVNITVNGAKYSNERQLAKAIAEEIQNMTNRKAAVYA